MTKKKDMKFNHGDVCKVYVDTPTFELGGLVIVIDRDPHDMSYIVADLRDVGKANEDVNLLLEQYAKWVDEDNLELIDFERPKSLWEKFKLLWTRKLKIKSLPQ